MVTTERVSDQITVKRALRGFFHTLILKSAESTKTKELRDKITTQNQTRRFLRGHDSHEAYMIQTWRLLHQQSGQWGQSTAVQSSDEQPAARVHYTWRRSSYEPISNLQEVGIPKDESSHSSPTFLRFCFNTSLHESTDPIFFLKPLHNLVCLQTKEVEHGQLDKKVRFSLSNTRY